MPVMRIEIPDLPAAFFWNVTASSFKAKQISKCMAFTSRTPYPAITRYGSKNAGLPAPKVQTANWLDTIFMPVTFASHARCHPANDGTRLQAEGLSAPVDHLGDSLDGGHRRVVFRQRADLRRRFHLDHGIPRG